MSKVLTAIVGSSALVVGYLFGNHGEYRPDTEYSVVRNGAGIVQLDARNVKKQYPINRVGGEVYVGNSQHQYDGLKALIEQEIAKQMATKHATEGLQAKK